MCYTSSPERGAALCERLGAIFDFDGVIIDSSPFHRESWKVLGREMGFTMSDEMFRETFGMTNPEIFVRLFGRRLPGEEAHALGERKEALYRELAAGRLHSLPGAVALLESLRAAGFRVALGSSAPKSNLDALLSGLGIERYLDATVNGNEVSHGKPHPEVFLTAAERIAAAPECCVVVEDALVGIEAAKAAGMRCIAITTTHPREKLARADRVVDSLAELSAEDFLRLLA